MSSAGVTLVGRQPGVGVDLVGIGGGAGALGMFLPWRGSTIQRMTPPTKMARVVAMER